MKTETRKMSWDVDYRFQSHNTGRDLAEIDGSEPQNPA
jgi:hypothetical protein